MNNQSGKTPQAVDRATRRRLRTRARLIDAARQLIVDKGYDAVTISDITDAADVGKGTFYLHFTDKEDLTKALVLDGLDKLVANSIRRRATEDPVSWRVEAVHAIFQYAHANRDLFHIMLGGGGSAQLSQLARDYAAQVMEGVLRDDVAAGRMLPYPPDLVAQIQTGAIVQTVVWWLQDPHGLAPDEIADAVVEILGRGILSAIDSDAPGEAM